MSGPPDARRRRYAAAALLWCLAALLAKPFYPYLDFGVFYSTAIEFILDGRPLEIYSFIAHPPGSDLALPLTNPPLGFFFLAPVYALGRLLGIADFHSSAGFSLGQAWMLLASLPFDLLLCFEALRLVERRRGRLAEPGRWFLYLCLLLSPLLWLSSVRYGHNEAMMAAMILLALRAGEEQRPWRCGVYWGLALALKTTAAAPALVWFGWSLGRERRRLGWRALLAAAAVFFLPLLPYLLLRREQVWYALAGFEGLRPVGGYVLWKLAPFPGWLVDLSSPLILAGSAALGLLLARRGGRDFLAAGGVEALALGQVLLLLLGKALFVWYGLALGVFCYLAFPPPARSGRLLPILPLAANFLLWLIPSGPWVGAAAGPAVLLRSALWVLFLLALGTILGWRLLSAGRRCAPSVG